MAFDIDGARKAGYSAEEIADYLGQESGFDTASALKSGYTPDEVIGHLSATPAKSTETAQPEKSFFGSVVDNATTLAKGVAASNPILGRALTVAQGPQEKKIGSVLEGKQMPGVPFDPAEADRLSRRDYAEEQEQAQRIAKAPEMRAPRDPILSDRQQFAERNPITAGFAQSAASTVAGALNAPSVAAGLAGETVNRVAQSMGVEQPAGRVPNMPLVNDIKSMGQDYASRLSMKSPGKAWDDGDFGRWMMTQLSGNSFSAAQSLGALFVPGAQATLLSSMGAVAGGNAYAEGDSASASTMKGLVEAGSEMLPLHAAEKIKDIVLAIPTGIRQKALAEAGKRLLASGTAVTTNSLVGAIEESVAEIGGNAIDKYVSGKTKDLFDGVDRAAIVGAAFGTAFSGPAIAETMASPASVRARELSGALQSGGFDPAQVEQTVMDTLRTEQSGGAGITPAATTISAADAQRQVQQQAIAEIGTAQNADEAIAAAQRAISTPIQIPEAESSAEIAQRIRELEGPAPVAPPAEQVIEPAPVTEQAAPVADVAMEKNGTLRVIGDTAAIRAQLAEYGITNVIPTASGAIIGRSQAQTAQSILMQGVADANRNGSMASPALAENAGTGQPIGGTANAGNLAQPAGGVDTRIPDAPVRETVVPATAAVDAQPALRQEQFVEPRIAGALPASTTAQRTVSRLQESIRKTYPDATFKAVGIPSGAQGRKMTEAAATAKRLFGIDVNYVQFDGEPLFEGARSEEFPSAIFIRADTKKPHMAILGHELLHQMRSSKPNLYRELNDSLASLIENEGKYSEQLASRYKAKGGTAPKEWMEELHADIVGDNFADPQFWADLAREKPGAFERIANAVRQFLNSILLKSTPFGSDQYLKDVKAARDVVTESIRKFSDAKDVAYSIDAARTQVQNLPDEQSRSTPGTGNRTVPARIPGTADQQRIADDIAKRVGARLGRPIVLDVIAPGRGESSARNKEESATVLTAKRLFNQNVIFVKQSERVFHGLMSAAYPNTVLIDIETDKPMMAILGHELLHQLRRNQPDIYRQLDERLTALLKNPGEFLDRIEAQYRNKGMQVPQNWDEELYADVVGDNFTDPEFWTAMAEGQPRLFQRVAQAIRQFLNNVLLKAKPFGTDQFMSDVKAARDAVTDAMRQFSGAEVGAMTDQVDGVALSVADSPYRIDDATGLPLNADGTVTVYHHTSKANADRIRQTGMLKAAAEPDVYVTTRSQTDTGYGDTAVAINVDPEKLLIDDEFPDGRVDYRLEVGRPGGSMRVKFPGNATPDDIRYAIAGPSQDWAIPEVSRLDRMIFELQDRAVDLKRVQESIKAAGKQIEEKFDARTAEALFPGRVAYRSDQFLKAEVRPLLQAMALNKVGMDEIADYLHARGAEERNAQIAKINPDMPDGGAGTNTKGLLLTNDAARDYLSSIPPARKKALDSIAAKVDAITKGTRELLVDEGLEKPEVVAAWEAAYKNYVPMFRDEAESGNPHPSGGGFSVRGGNSQRATGSTKAVTNILAHVLMQREAAITKAEKNRVGLSLYGLALSNPNPEFWTTIRPGMQASQIAADLQAMGVDPVVAEAGMQGVPTVRTVDPILNRVVDRANPMYKSLPGAVTLKIGGEDRVLMFNEKQPRALRMAEALKNLDGLTRFDLAGSMIGRMTRWMAAVNTQYNPAFGIVNGIRDTLGGAVNLTSTPLRGKSTQVLFDAYTKAGPGIAKELINPGSQGEWSKLYRQFQEDGGQTGYREMFKDANERTKNIEKELAKAQKEGKLTPGKAAHFALDLLDGFNTSIENAVRLAAYKAALDQGISRAQAAKIGRELTVDFNRKGRAGRELGPLYAFFNASIQGGARTIEALQGPAGTRIITGGLALGALQAVMMAMAGFDDDEIPEFIKTRALIIPLFNKDKQFIAIPLPLGLHVLPNTGRVIAEMALNGGKNVGKRSFEAIGEVAGAFNPLGGGNIFTGDGALKTIAPTFVDPVIELFANKNFAGNTISRESRGETDVRPGFARAKESTQRALTGQAYLGISKTLNKAMGGTDYEAGLVSPTPEQLQYIAQVAGGGVLREMEKIINISDAMSKGDEVKKSRIPVVGRLFGEVDEDAVQKSRYFEASKKFDKAQSAFKAAQKAGDVEALQRMMDNSPELVLGKTQDKVAQEIAKLNRLAVTTINDRETLLQVDEARLKYMEVLNKAVRQQEEQSGKKTPGQKLRELVKSKTTGGTEE